MVRSIKTKYQTKDSDSNGKEDLQQTKEGNHKKKSLDKLWKDNRPRPKRHEASTHKKTVPMDREVGPPRLKRYESVYGKPWFEPSPYCEIRKCRVERMKLVDEFYQ